MSPVAEALVVVLLVSGMLAMGALLRPADIAARLRAPGPIAVALLVNLVAVPAAAIAAVTVLPVSTAVALGVVLVAAAPGGGTGALLSHHAGGDPAHAVVLQGLLAGTSLVSAPLWFLVYAESADVSAVDPLRLAIALVLCQLVPLAVGSWLRTRRPAAADRVQPVARRVADVSLVALVLGLLVTEGSRLGDNGTGGLVAMAAVVAVTAVLGLLPLAGSAVRRATTLTTMVRNLSMALLVAATTAEAEQTVLAILSYGLAMYVAAALVVVAFRRSRSSGLARDADLQSAA